MSSKSVLAMLVEGLVADGGISEVLNEAGRQLGDPKCADMGKMGTQYKEIVDGLKGPGLFFIRSLADISRMDKGG